MSQATSTRERFFVLTFKEQVDAGSYQIVGLSWLALTLARSAASRSASYLRLEASSLFFHAIYYTMACVCAAAIMRLFSWSCWVWASARRLKCIFCSSYILKNIHSYNENLPCPNETSLVSLVVDLTSNKTPSRCSSNLLVLSLL